MFSYIVRRLFLMVPTLIGITAVVFFVMAMSPGGVGGSLLNELGEMEAEKAKALRDYYNKRYGLDQPLPIQYARWLNRVSPVGFLTSSQIEFPADERDQAANTLRAGLPHATPLTIEQAISVTTAIASFQDKPLLPSAHKVIAAVNGPGDALTLFQQLDAQPSADLTDQYRSAAPLDRTKAGQLMLRSLADVATGKDRVLLSRLTLKAPDLGESLAKGRPVIDLYREALPVTLLLNLITTPVIYAISILTGIYAARHRGKLFDVGSGFTLLGLWSLPLPWVAVMMIGFVANEENLRLFPAGGLSSTMANHMSFLPSHTPDGWIPGWLLDRAWHLFLPICCLTYGGFAVLSKLMRSAMLENLSADFVRTARAKGLDDNTVLWRHGFRNSLLPLITVAASILPSLLVGSVILEMIFSIPGMGKLTIEAINARDRELILAGTLIGGVIGLVCILIADLCYAIADPRVSYD